MPNVVNPSASGYELLQEVDASGTTSVELDLPADYKVIKIECIRAVPTVSAAHLVGTLRATSGGTYLTTRYDSECINIRNRNSSFLGPFYPTQRNDTAFKCFSGYNGNENAITDNLQYEVLTGYYGGSFTMEIKNHQLDMPTSGTVQGEYSDTAGYSRSMSASFRHGSTATETEPVDRIKFVWSGGQSFGTNCFFRVLGLK